MRSSQKTTAMKRKRRHIRVRGKVTGSAARPRLNVFRSNARLSLQIIDDVAGKTLVSIDSKTAKPTGDAGERTGGIAAAYLLGKALAEKAVAAKISTVVFDRGGYTYHGRVKAVAEGARDGGLEF